MAIEHILTAADTLYSLAEEHLNDPNRWREIADYNGLNAPYLVGSRAEAESRYGRGYLTVTRASFETELILPKGWTFQTKPYIIGGMVKTFVVTEQTVVPEGVATFHVHVRSTVGGTYGNVAAGSITEPGPEFREADIALVSVVNERTFEGGTDSRVLTVGDSIYIPTDDLGNTVPKDIREQLEYIGGEDFLLLPNIGYERYIPSDGYGDYASVSGLDNIAQAVNDRLMTEKGDLPLHPEYGTNLALLVGTAHMPYTDKLAEIEIYDALAYEDRIRDVQIVNLDIEGTSIKVDIRCKPYYATRDILINIALDFKRGGNRHV